MIGDQTRHQKYLGTTGLMLFLGALSAFPVLSTDLYLPALPGMTVYFGVPEYQTNLTLILFFIVYAIALLTWGPLSDRFGRKPVLLVGLTCYVVAGALCALSHSIFQLMAFRIFQALGTGAASTVATAIVKDAYRGKKRETTLAVVQSLTVLAPLVAPMLGALILRLTSWRGVFAVQAGLGVLVLVGAIAFQETLGQRLTGNPLASLRRLGVVLKNGTFTLLLINLSLVSMAGLAFVSSSSYIFQVTFGLSSQAYSFFFALFGVGIAVGPPLFILLSRWHERTRIITACLIVCALSGVLILVFGRMGPWPFIAALFLTPVSLSCVRPPSTYLMLGQHEGDAGSVSALVTASYMVMGSVGTAIVSLELWDRVLLIGTLILVVGLLSLGLWLSLGRPRVLAQAPVDAGEA